MEVKKILSVKGKATFVAPEESKVVLINFILRPFYLIRNNFSKIFENCSERPNTA